MILNRCWATTNAMVLFALFLVGPCCPGARAQTSHDVATCLSGWEWNQNSLGQCPCLVASVLEAACRETDSYGVPSLPSGQSYRPPQGNSSGDLACECDTVTYSLYMACARCQGEDHYVYSWVRWIAECDAISIGLYPRNIPNGTAIPRWAFYNVTSIPDQTYDDTLAMSIGRDPEATPEPPGADRPHRKKGIGGIVGGAVGGAVLLLILVLAAALIIRRRRKYRSQETPAHFRGQLAPPDPRVSILSGIYNPDDPNTYPPPFRRSTPTHSPPVVRDGFPALRACGSG